MILLRSLPCSAAIAARIARTSSTMGSLDMSYASISSSGVQMIGAGRPAPRHVCSILPRIAAFAMCVQFHVTK
jgi:hypothetical protein